MRFSLFKKIDNYLIDILQNRIQDASTLMMRKTFILGSAVVVFFVTCLTLVCLFLDLRILFFYGFFLLTLYSAAVIIFIMAKRNPEWFGIIAQTLLIISSFVCILFLGGIVHSAGIVFVGLAAVIFSVVFQQVRVAFAFSIFYASTIVAAGILQPELKVPEAMTPGINLLFFVLNAVWISAFILAFVVSYIQGKIKEEQDEVTRLKELDVVRTRLFTSISHQCRTPLTIILGLAKQLRHSDEASPEIYEAIIRNGKQILSRINQMLDLTRIEAGSMPIHLIQGNIVEFLRILIESFQPLSSQKGINLSFISGSDYELMDFDKDKLVDIFSNLISNAIKFTHAGGKVLVQIEIQDGTSDRELIVRVRDNGIGIPEENLPFVFDTYYQAVNNESMYYGGTGIGLTITRELINLLGGYIQVESCKNKGTSFILYFPVTNNAPIVKTFDLSLEESAFYHISASSALANTNENKTEIDKNLPYLLLAEDNVDLVSYIRSVIGNEYNIFIASDGKMAIERAIEIIPDIIISDLMMPVMDGFSFIKKLKEDIRTSHIPIIILTARADLQSKLEGFDLGADAYISKPFVEDELRIRLKSLILLRRKLQEKYIASGWGMIPEKTSRNNEEIFIRNVLEIIKNNMHDDSFGITLICLSIGMSRAQLYRKFKALTDKSIYDYIRTMRLEKARMLLERTDINVSEAAYATGFRNISHFSRIFTEHFGLHPSDLRKK